MEVPNAERLIVVTDEASMTPPPPVALSGTVLAVVRATALFNGRDPESYTAADCAQALNFMNMFQAALWESRHNNPCGRCRGTGVEPRGRQAQE